MSEEISQNTTGSNEKIEILVNAAEPEDREQSPKLLKEINIISSQSSYLSSRSSISEKDEKSIQEDQENSHEIEEKNFEEISNFQNKDILNGEKYIPEAVADYDREELIKQYKEIMEEKLKLQKNNTQYQRKLAEYFQKKRNDEQGMDIEKNENEQDQRYTKYITNFKELQSEEAHQTSSIRIQVEEFRKRCGEKLKEVEEISKAFIDFKYNIGRNAISSHSGKRIASKDLELYHILEMRKEQEVIACRLENIKLKNKLKKYEMQLKVKEELGEGLHLIDFEQLKIENQTFNEKIEDRNEELMKLRKKITTTVQIFAHLKEKLQFVQGENVELSKNLQDLDVTVAQRREILTRTKQVRDSLRTDNNKLKHQSGLLGNETLLLDFERCVDEGEHLRTRLAQLKTQHKELTICLKTLQKKIEQSSSTKIT